MIKKRTTKVLGDILYTGLALCLSLFLYWYSLKSPLIIETSPHQLSETTQTLLKSINEPLTITLITQDIDTHHLVQMLIERYQRHQQHIHFSWKKEEREPTHPHHALVIESGKSKQVIDLDKTPLDENKLTNALLKSLASLINGSFFLQGHGEPSPFASQNSDLSLFRLGLENQGIKIQELNLTQTGVIPDNTQVLIIASLKSALLPLEEKLIKITLLKEKVCYG